MERSLITRRHVLAAIGISALGGCVDQFSSGSESGIRLGSIRIANLTGEPCTVDLLMERNNETVHHETYELPAEDHVWIEPTWSSKPATYDFYYTLSGVNDLKLGRLSDLHVEETDGDCMFADLWISEEFQDSFMVARDVAEEEEATCNF